MANTQNLDLVKPLGTDYALVSVLNSNSDKIDAYAGAVNASLDGLRDGLGILADGNTHAAVTSGQFVYVKNHQTLPQGLYQATTNIAANGTLSTSNLVADPKGGLNTLSEQIGNLNSNLETYHKPQSKNFFVSQKTSYDINIPNGARCVIYGFSGGINRFFECMVDTDSSGSIKLFTVNKGNEVTLSSSNNKVSVSYESSGSFNVGITVFNPENGRLITDFSIT